MPPRTRRLALPTLALALTALLPATARAAEPALTVPRAQLAAALHCGEGVRDASRTPIMLVTGTGATGAEAYAIGRPVFDAYGAPVCYVDFPNSTTADLQVSVQYLVHGLRVMARRAGRRVAVFGISQGALLPRVALTYWPSLRRRVSDVVGAAGPHHGTTVPRALDCRRLRLACIPASWQQAAGSRFLRALNARGDETPGPTAWTTVRSSTDETVQPMTGPRPTAALSGATNVLIQDVCPGRAVSHIGTALDSVTFALIDDAIRHRGPAKVSRLPAGVCSRPYALGLDEAATANLLGAAGGLTQGRYASEPRVRREPRVRAWMRSPRRR